MSKVFFERIHQQRLQADLSQIARVVRDDAVEAITVITQASVFVQPFPLAFVAPVAAPSVDDIAVDVIPPESPAGAIPSVEIEFLVDIAASLSEVATPSVNDEVIDVISPESPTITVVAIIVSVT
jgi:hypothetical protein